MSNLIRISRFAILASLTCLLFGNALLAHDNDPKNLSNTLPAGSGGSGSGAFSSKGAVMLGHLEMDQMGGGGSVTGNDCWGWTDATTGRKFALMGQTNGAAFVEVTDPTNPLYLGKLPTAESGQNRAWRDIKVYADHAFIVADGGGNDQGIQVFDLSQLLTADPNNPQTFSATANYYQGFAPSHNIAINEDTGYAYVVGARTPTGGLYHRGGLVILDVSDPLNITEVGNFSDDGYTHDCQAVIYNGPDTTYVGQEIVFACNENSLTIVDVTDKSNTIEIKRRGYTNANYAHQGWLSEDHKYFYMDDELDEYNHARGPDGQFGTADDGDPIPTITHIWNVQDLDNPIYVGTYQGVEKTIDHNLYTKGNFIYQGNYTAGMRILQIDENDPTNLTEYGFFDSYPANNGVSFGGVWSVYPYFDYGDDDIILMSDRQGGLFMVQRVPPPSVETVEINTDAQPQRSAVDSLSLSFEGNVVFEPGAFSVIQRNDATKETMEAVTINVTEQITATETVATIQFSSHVRNSDNVLEDGYYQLSIDGSMVTREGIAMTEDFEFGDVQADGFRSFYGDITGEGTVNVIDLLAFRGTYGLFDGDPNFEPCLDYDGGGVVNVLDLLQFRGRFGLTLPFFLGGGGGGSLKDGGKGSLQSSPVMTAPTKYPVATSKSKLRK